MQKKILLSNLHLKDFGGSELVTIELAEYFASQGHLVTVYSPLLGHPVIGSTKHHPNPFLYSQEVPKNLWDFDLIWSHHNLLLDQIHSFNKRDHQIIVSNHMSSYVREEFPTYNADKVDFIFANSPETIDKMPAAHKAKAQVFANPAPRLKKTQQAGNAKLFGLCVSNHIPSELRSFLYANADKVRSTHIGRGGQFTLRLSPSELKNVGCDFVICNGKTVQYALSAGIPVFLYDQFGGPGWLTEDNFERAAKFNFSGRGFVSSPAEMKMKSRQILETLFDIKLRQPIAMTPERNERFILEDWMQKHANILGLET